MKTNCWLILGVMMATSAVAQNNPNCRRPGVHADHAPAGGSRTRAGTGHGNRSAGGKIQARQTQTPRRRQDGPDRRADGHAGSRPGASRGQELIVRGQAGLKGEVVAHLNKGDTVTVLSQINLDKHKADEPAQWAKIALPASTHVWVFAKFIDEANNTVSPKKLNLRAGPGENYSVLGVIERGTAVNIIRPRATGWKSSRRPTPMLLSPRCI